MIKLFFFLTLLTCNSNKSQHTNIINDMTPSIHNLSYKSINGETISLSKYKGKKILIVNTASECGYTPQYKQLQELYENFSDKLVVIGFPANDFGQQEPGSNEDIQSFCEKNYGVTFPLSEKVTVKGDNTDPIFVWLTSKSKNGVMDVEVKWNFTKFLLDEEGRLLQSFESKVTPLDEAILSFLK